MENWFIKYQVRIENESPTPVCPIERGIVCAENYGKAAEKIEEFYGPDLIEILQLKYLSENFLILPQSIMKEVEEALEA